MAIAPPIVVGAGPAGLAAAAMLKSHGVRAVVLERSAELGASWRRHYDSLRLHTPRRLSELPGMSIPASAGRWVARDDVVAYLAAYAEHHRLDVRLETEAERLERCGSGWLVLTSQGAYESHAVVVATGYACDPFVPAWRGRARYRGNLLHSVRYRNAEPYRGREVLVVGSGNSAAEIALDLARGGASRVWLAVRTPPQVVPRQALGVPAQAIGIAVRRLPATVGDLVGRLLESVFVGDLTRYGMPAADSRPYSEFLRRRKLPILDAGFADALRRGRIVPVAAVEAFEPDAVVLANGTRLLPDAVIAATGYATGLEPLVGHLGVLDEGGYPRALGAECPPGWPGLYFSGFANPISGALRECAIEARRIAHAVAGRQT